MLVKTNSKNIYKNRRKVIYLFLIRLHIYDGFIKIGF